MPTVDYLHYVSYPILLYEIICFEEWTRMNSGPYFRLMCSFPLPTAILYVVLVVMIGKVLRHFVCEVMTLCSHCVSDADDSYKGCSFFSFHGPDKGSCYSSCLLSWQSCCSWLVASICHDPCFLLFPSHWHPVLKVGSLLPWKWKQYVPPKQW
jgi:hypothetical protein